MHPSNSLRIGAGAPFETERTSGLFDDQAHLPALSNAVLAELSSAELLALRPLLSTVTLRAGDLFDPGLDEPRILFIDAGLVRTSVIHPDGRSTTTMLVGPEGAVGLSSLFSDQLASPAAIVMRPGAARSVSARALRQLAPTAPGLMLAIARQLSREITGTQAEFACSAHHTVEQRLAKLLLQIRQKLGSDRLVITQEELALTLGVQRSTVSTIAHRFKALAAIEYLRGAIQVVDPDGLARAACSCAVPQSTAVSRDFSGDDLRVVGRAVAR